MYNGEVAQDQSRLGAQAHGPLNVVEDGQGVMLLVCYTPPRSFESITSILLRIEIAVVSDLKMGRGVQSGCANRTKEQATSFLGKGCRSFRP
jgi:hypothetical protein